MALPKGKYYSVNETASILGLSEKTIRRRIKSGTITSKKVGRTYQVYIPEDDLPKTTIKEDKIPPKEDETIKKIAEQLKEVKEEIKKPKDNKTDKSDKMTGQQSGHLIDVLIKQLDEKDKLIKELNERIREAHVLASGRLLGNGKQEQEQEQDQGEIIYATGNVSNESENVTTQPTKDKKQLWNTIITGLVLLATLGLIGLMIYQSGIIRF